MYSTYADVELLTGVFCKILFVSSDLKLCCLDNLFSLYRISCLKLRISNLKEINTATGCAHLEELFCFHQRKDVGNYHETYFI